MLEDATSQFARLVEQASQGEAVINVRDSISVAKIILLSEEKPEKRQGGFGSGKYALIYMADDLDALLEDFK